ncbi:hypothetical protein D3C85_841330 [compost metagenome]
MFQLAEVVGQPVFRGASLLDFNGHGLDVLVGDLDQYADFVIFMVCGTVQRRLVRAAWISQAQLANDPDQRLGEHDVEQCQENPAEYQATEKTVEQGDSCSIQKAGAEGVSVDLQ